MMIKSEDLVPELVSQRIHYLRGQKVMLDSDLAFLYNVETRALVQAVKRNTGRFPSDFMFQLTNEEWDSLRSQNVISKGRGGRRYAPYVFTEHGVLMLSSVINSETAVEVGLVIVRTFVYLREMLSTHKELATKLEELERKTSSHDQAIAGLIDAIRNLMQPSADSSRPIGFTANISKPKNK
jgi:hypothetical protein